MDPLLTEQQSSMQENQRIPKAQDKVIPKHITYQQPPPPPPPPPQLITPVIISQRPPVLMVQQQPVMVVQQPQLLVQQPQVLVQSMSPFQVGSKMSCPSCGFSQTLTQNVIGNKLILWSIILWVFTCCLCWIPLLMDDCYDQEIVCTRCGCMILRVRR